MAQKYEIKKAARARFIYKALQNETLVKRNVNCKKYTTNINLYDKAWIFLKKNLKKIIIITTHLDAEGVRWPRTKLFLSLVSLQYKILLFNQGCFSYSERPTMTFLFTVISWTIRLFPWFAVSKSLRIEVLHSILSVMFSHAQLLQGLR